MTQSIKIGQDVFIIGKTKCPTCPHRRPKFRYMLTFQQLLVWDHQCAKHSKLLGKLPDKDPAKSIYYTDILDVEDYKW